MAARSSLAATAAVPESSQYHHYIPRFILKNFAHPFDSKGSKRNRKKGPRQGDAMLNIIDLEGNGEIIEASVSKSFGLTDMCTAMFMAQKSSTGSKTSLPDLKVVPGRYSLVSGRVSRPAINKFG